MFVTVNKKSVRVELNPIEAQKHAKRMQYIMRLQEQKALEEQAKMAARKVCPDCHVKCTFAGFCVQCDKDCRDLKPKPQPDKIVIHRPTPKVQHVTDRDSDWGYIKVKI